MGIEGRFYSCDWRDVESEAALVSTMFDIEEKNVIIEANRKVERNFVNQRQKT